ncbi:MAG: hypothetical protein ACXAEX_11530 [Promethearchaeota archaeon]|jgi:flap endonuclease-1
MGVKLQEIIIRTPIDYQKLVGKIIAVDAPNIIMALFNFARKNPDGSNADIILDRTQRPISHLYGLLYRVIFYYSKKFFPVFCFDGRDSDLKKNITKDQLKDFYFTQKWYEAAISRGDRNAARKIALSKEYLWQNIIQESKQLLGAIGVPYIESPASAESQCAYLVREKIVDYSNSQDFDSLLFGCPFLIQNLSKSMRRKVQGKWTYSKITPCKTNLQKNLKLLEIDRFQLVDLGILVGTDYFPGISGLGPKKSLAFIQKYRQIEKIPSSLREKYDFKFLTSDLLSRIRKIFLFPEVNTSIKQFYWNVPNKSRTLSFLCDNHHLNKQRVENNFEKLVSNYQKCRSYFLNSKISPRKIQLTLDI